MSEYLYNGIVNIKRLTIYNKKLLLINEKYLKYYKKNSFNKNNPRFIINLNDNINVKCLKKSNIYYIIIYTINNEIILTIKSKNNKKIDTIYNILTNILNKNKEIIITKNNSNLIKNNKLFLFNYIKKFNNKYKIYGTKNNIITIKIMNLKLKSYYFIIILLLLILITYLFFNHIIIIYLYVLILFYLLIYFVVFNKYGYCYVCNYSINIAINNDIILQSFKHILTTNVRESLCDNIIVKNNTIFIINETKKEQIKQDIKLLYNKIIILEYINNKLYQIFNLNILENNLELTIFTKEKITNYYIFDNIIKSLKNRLSDNTNITNNILDVNEDITTIKKINNSNSFISNNLKNIISNKIDYFEKEIINKNWKQEDQLDNTYYKYNKLDKKYICKKTVLYFNHNYNKIYEFYCNRENEIKFNSSVESLNKLYELSDMNVSIEELSTKGNFIVNKRKFIFYNYSVINESFAYIISFSDKSLNNYFDNNSNFVKGWVRLVAKKIEKLEESKTKITIITEIDPCIKLIPISILNKIIKQNSKINIKIKEYLDKNM